MARSVFYFLNTDKAHQAHLAKTIARLQFSAAIHTSWERAHHFAPAVRRSQPAETLTFSNNTNYSSTNSIRENVLSGS
jgi:hypothetical protein